MKQRLITHSDLDQLSDDFPEDYFRMKILPELLKSVEFGGGGPKVFAVVMKIGSKLTDEDFEAKITPVVVRLFTSPDRAIRVYLLDNLPRMIDRLSPKVVNDKIFPHMVSTGRQNVTIITKFSIQVTGFTDLAPIVREQTVKAVLTVINKLSDRTINGELLKYLAKTSNDEQPGIRTNTTICLGKISKNLGISTRSKVLIAAFSRSIRDPFVHARNASLMALAATADLFNEDDCANRIMPAICPALIDKEKLVRDQANKTLDLYLSRMRKAASIMADSVLPPPSASEVSAAGVPRMSTPQPSEAASWTGWAISSFTNKLSAAAGEMQSTANESASNNEGRPNSAPQVGEARRPNSTTASASALHRQAVISPPATSARTSISSNANDYFQDAPELGNDDFEAWGDMEEDSFFDATSDKSKPESVPAVSVTPFEDNGEPDFAGWLAAQSGKKTSTKPLPKGLAKPASSSNSAMLNGRPAGAVRSTTTGNIGSTTKRPIGASAKPQPKSISAKKIDTTPKASADDDGWGDGWD
jgi:SCY1-like protein 1